MGREQEYTVEIKFQGKPSPNLFTGRKSWDFNGRHQEPKVTPAESDDGITTISCGRMSKRAVQEALEKLEVQIRSISFRDRYGRVVTVSYEGGGIQKDNSLDSLSNVVPWRSLLRSGGRQVVVYHQEESETDRRNEEFFFANLDGLSLERREGLYLVVGRIVKELNPSLVGEPLREWHFVDFEDGKEMSVSNLLQPLESIAPPLFEAAVNYVEAYETGMKCWTETHDGSENPRALDVYMSKLIGPRDDILSTVLLEVMDDKSVLDQIATLAERPSPVALM